MTSTQKVLRRAVLDELGGSGVYTTTGAGSTTTLVCTDAFKSSAVPASHLPFAWIHVPTATAPKERRVPQTGLDPTTGTITVDAAYGSSIGSSTEFEVCNLMPLIDSGNKSAGLSVNQCINLALRHLTVPDLLDVPTVAGAQSYSLATYAEWLDSIERLDPMSGGPIWDPARASGWPKMPSRIHNWRLSFDGGTPTLHFLEKAYPRSGFIFQIAVKRPAYTLISGSESTVGLAADTDTTIANRNDVVTAALVFAYKALAEGRGGWVSGEYADKYVTQLADARRLLAWDHSRDQLPAQAAAPQGAA